jgi:transposase InsO family protein
MTLARVLNEETVQPQRSANDGDAPAAWHRWQNGHVERVIGSIRRESLDRLVVFDEAQLRRVLKNYASYYNQVRTHLSLNKNAPDFRRPQKLGPIAGISIFQALAFD